MKILMVGDIVGSAGRTVFARIASSMKQSGKADFVVANAENAAGGKGLTDKLAAELFAAGADILTMGDHTWDQKTLGQTLDREPRILRPANFAPACPGQGIITVATKWGNLTVINLIGRIFMAANDCPFRTATAILDGTARLGKIILVDFHAEATSEKNALGIYLDGRVTAVAGTHTHVQTCDERILPGGTGYITDLGMTGPQNSIIGCTAKSVLPIFLTGMKAKFEVAQDKESAALEGIVLDVNQQTGRAKSIRRLRCNLCEK